MNFILEMYYFLITTEPSDFIFASPKCEPFKFERKKGTQKKCAFIRIVEDSIKEGNEQFSVSLEHIDPYVISGGIDKATVTIIDSPTSAIATRLMKENEEEPG